MNEIRAPHMMVTSGARNASARRHHQAGARQRARTAASGHRRVAAADCALGIGFWQHYTLHAEVMATAEQRRDFVPSVRTAPVRASAARCR